MSAGENLSRNHCTSFRSLSRPIRTTLTAAANAIHPMINRADGNFDVGATISSVAPNRTRTRIANQKPHSASIVFFTHCTNFCGARNPHTPTPQRETPAASTVNFDNVTSIGVPSSRFECRRSGTPCLLQMPDRYRLRQNTAKLHLSPAKLCVDPAPADGR